MRRWQRLRVNILAKTFQGKLNNLTVSPIAQGRCTYNSCVDVALHITTAIYYPSHPYGNA